MIFTPVLQNLQQRSSDDIILRKGQKSPAEVRALQMMLQSLGYAQALNWHKYRADGDYGGSTTAALKAFLTANGLAGDGSTLTKGTLSLLQEKLALLGSLRASNAPSQDGKAKGLGPDWQTSLQEKDPGGKESYATQGNRIIAMNDWLRIRFTKKSKGVYTFGKADPADFVRNRAQLFLQHGLTESALRVIAPVSGNEGKLEAVNTWDNCYMTFGMFQWTLGVKTNKGELPALLKRLAEEEPTAFATYFGQYGITVTNASRTTGHLHWNGQQIDSVAEKEKFRKKADWAFRFWLAGLDERVQRVQILHALDRINSFSRNDYYRPLGKFYIDELVTSEYGICLLLDHHVNRPGHLQHAYGDIVGKALRSAKLENSKPSDWDTATEQRLIEAYLPLRYASSMTHSKERAARIAKARDRGDLSTERYSFRMQNTRSVALPETSNYPPVDPEAYETRIVFTEQEEG